MSKAGDEKAFFYAVYLMGIRNGVIEPLEGVKAPNMMAELPADSRPVVEAIRDMEINWESPPEEVERFFMMARDFVSGFYTD
jgi:hypothetical protein